VGVAGHKEPLVELLYVSFAGGWGACESYDSKQSTGNESFEDTQWMCGCPWEIEIEVCFLFSKSVEVTWPSLMERVMLR